MLLFLKTAGSPESALMFGFICYLFLYALYLIQLLEQPFLRLGSEPVKLGLLRFCGRRYTNRNGQWFGLAHAGGGKHFAGESRGNRSRAAALAAGRCLRLRRAGGLFSRAGPVRDRTAGQARGPGGGLGAGHGRGAAGENSKHPRNPAGFADGVEPAALDRIKAPAGLDLGAITSEEIGLSILAEIIRDRRSG